MKNAIESVVTLALAMVLDSTLLLSPALAVAGEKAAGASRQSALWDQADVNEDGYVSREEASAAGRTAHSAIDFMAADKDSDGRVSKDEYAAAQVQPRAADVAGNHAVTERGAAGPAGPEREK